MTGKKGCCRWVLSLSVTLLHMEVCSQPSFPQNPALASLPDTSWLQVTDRWHDDPNTFSITDYSGMVYDHHRHKLLLFGHGHAAFGGNEVMEFDIDNAVWDTLYRYTPCSQYAPEFAVYDSSGNRCGGIYDTGGNAMPSSRHTYDGVVMAADTCLMILVSSPFSGSGGNNCPLSGKNDEWTGKALWMFDPVAKVWSHTRGEMGVGSNPAGVALDPRTNLIYMLKGSGQEFAVADFINQTRSVLDESTAPNWEGSRACNYYAPNHSLLFFGKDDVWEWFIDTPEKSWVRKSPEGTHIDAYGRQVCFDEVNTVFALFKDNGFHYYSYPENRWYSIPYDGKQYPADIAFMNTVYDPVDNVYLLVNKPAYNDLQTWAFKFCDTPGRFPGTSVLSIAPDRQFSAGLHAGSLNCRVLPGGKIRITVEGGWRMHRLPPRIVVVDAKGKIVYEHGFPGTEIVVSLPVNGLYFVRILGEERSARAVVVARY